MLYQIIPVTAYQQNCSLVYCANTKKGALIDPGGDVEVLTAAVQRAGVQLEKILLTHGHLDHAGGARILADQFGIPLIGPHEADAYWLQALNRQAQMFGFPEVESFLPDRWLNEGDVIEFGEQHLEVLHCPGHTPGHVVFVNRKDSIAFVGDVLFQGSIGRTDFPGGDYDTLIDSIKRKLLPLGDGMAFVPGHGPISTMGAERKGNPFLV